MSWFEDLFKGDNTLLGAGVGALLGATQGDKGGEVTQTQAIDPRIANILYGQDNKGGLLADAQSIYSQQMQQGGLNDMQRQGLNMQAQYLQSPQYQNSYQMMMNQGMGLLNSPIAGNPFTRSQGGQQSQPMGQGGFQYSQAPTQIQTIRPQVQAPTQQTAPQASQPSAMQRETQGGGFTIGGGRSSGDGGQGNSEAVTKASLAAMALGENPLLRALFPTWAIGLGEAGKLGADQQINARTATFNKLKESAPLANLGIGTVSDADGNVRTITTPAMIDAADASMFGDTGAGASIGNNYGFNNSRSGGNIGSMGGGQGVRGTANGGLSSGFQGGGGLGIRGSW